MITDSADTIIQSIETELKKHPISSNEIKILLDQLWLAFFSQPTLGGVELQLAFLAEKLEKNLEKCPSLISLIVECYRIIHALAPGEYLDIYPKLVNFTHLPDYALLFAFIRPVMEHDISIETESFFNTKIAYLFAFENHKVEKFPYYYSPNPVLKVLYQTITSSVSLDELYETALQNPKSAYISLLNYQIAYSHLYGKQVDETKGIAALQAVFNDAELPLALAHRCRNILINLATNNRKEFVRYSANVALAQLYLKDAKAEPIKFCKLALLRKALQCLEAATNVDYSAGHINELKASIYRALADLYKSFGITYKQEVARYYQRASDAGDKKAQSDLDQFLSQYAPVRQNNNFSTAAPKIETTLVDYQDEIQRLKIQLSQKELENTRLQQEVARLQKENQSLRSSQSNPYKQSKLVKVVTSPILNNNPTTTTPTGQGPNFTA